MSVVFLTFTIGMLNLCLGYALAVYLGFGPPSLLDAWDALVSDRPAETGEPSDQQEEVSQLSAMSLDDMLDEGTDDALEIEPYDEPYDDDAAELLGPDDPEDWNLDEKYVETSILKLNIAMMKSGKRATDIDTRLRAAAGNSDAETIQQCLAQLKEDCESYLVEQSQASEKFVARIGELGELKSLGEEIEMANLEQAAQIETTLSNLAHMDFESDLEAANHRLLEELNSLRAARHRLRDNQEIAFLSIARYENRLEAIEPQLYNDPLTKLRNRIGLETTLFEWWKQGRHQSRQINAVLLDLDAFGPLNEKHGSFLGDRILSKMAELLQELSAQGDLVGRFSGQRFLMMMVDVGPRAATKRAEQFRQSIEKTIFCHEGKRISTTVTCAITEVKPDDADEAVCQRLVETVKQAKGNGPNQSFFHDGSEATPVDSPKLGAEEVEIEI